jgi:hypothetical protein
MKYQFVCLDPHHWSVDGGSPFNEDPRTHASPAVDSVHESVDIFHWISSKKNKSENLEIHQDPGFLQKHPELFWNYILIPAILHLGPCLTFYNYD